MELYFNNTSYNFSNKGLFEATKLVENMKDYTSLVDGEKAKKAMSEPVETNDFIKKLNGVIQNNSSDKDSNNQELENKEQEINNLNNSVKSILSIVV